MTKMNFIERSLEFFVYTHRRVMFFLIDHFASRFFCQFDRLEVPRMLEYFYISREREEENFHGFRSKIDKTERKKKEKRLTIEEEKIKYYLRLRLRIMKKDVIG